MLVLLTGFKCGCALPGCKMIRLNVLDKLEAFPHLFCLDEALISPSLFAQPFDQPVVNVF